MRLIIAAAAALTASAGAFASEDAPRVEITYQASDIRTEEGFAALEARIEDAAEQVCERERSSDLNARYFQRNCIAAATQDAIAQVDLNVVSER